MSMGSAGTSLGGATNSMGGRLRSHGIWTRLVAVIERHS